MTEQKVIWPHVTLLGCLAVLGVTTAAWRQFGPLNSDVQTRIQNALTNAQPITPKTIISFDSHNLAYAGQITLKDSSAVCPEFHVKILFSGTKLFRPHERQDDMRFCNIKTVGGP